MDSFIVEGNISVKAVLQANRRKVYKIVVDHKKKDRDTSYILRLAKSKHIEIETSTREKIDEIASGKTHGGLIAYCGERQYQNLSSILQQKDIFLALVEGVEDPFNFGYVLRTLYAAGCDGIILSPRNWTSAVNTVTKSSAGASEYMNIFISDDHALTLQTLKSENVHIICAQRSDAISLYDYEFPNRSLIAIGGEMRGLSKAVLNESDQNLFIPYRQDFKNAMSAASATSIFAFEFVRQRELNKK